MDGMFHKVVVQIFGNWTALRLAVEHSMGGPNSKQIAIDSVNYIAQYCISENSIEVEDIQDVLDDIMDQEFNTICEDNSIIEVSNLLFKFRQILKNGDNAQYECEFNKLPNNNNWLSVNQDVKEYKQVEVPEPASSSTEMETDSEWTQVKSRKKR